MTLSTVHLSKRFGALSVIEDLSITFEPGIIHAVIGSNGAGKSTLINLITGAYAPSGGAIRLGDLDLTGLKKWQIARAGVARTYQNIRLFDAMTALENLEAALFARDRSQILAELIRPSLRARRRREECLDWLERFDLAIEADMPAGSLSYGKQKLLEIVRALVADPKVLLLDEPAAGLNQAETAELRERLKTLRRANRVLVFVEHDMSLVMSVSDRVTVLHQGAILSSGAPAEVAVDPAVQEAYLGNENEHEAIRILARGRANRVRLRHDHDLAWREPQGASR